MRGDVGASVLLSELQVLLKCICFGQVRRVLGIDLCSHGDHGVARAHPLLGDLVSSRRIECAWIVVFLADDPCGLIPTVRFRHRERQVFFQVDHGKRIERVEVNAHDGAIFRPSGGALLQSQEATKPPPPVVTELPVDTEKEEIKYDIAGYEKGNFDGFFVQSRDGQFRLNIGAYSQLRYDLVWRETPPAGDRKFESGFVVPRTRFFFEGKMTDHIEYQLRIQVDDAGDFGLVAAYAGYNFKNYHHRSANNGGAWNLRVGRQFAAITREDWMYAQDLLTTNSSAVDQVFAVGSSDGVQAFYGRDRGRVWFALTNGVAGGKEDFPNNTTSQALLSARGEVQLLGDDWNVFNDLVGRRGRPLGVLLGVGSGPLAAQTSRRGLQLRVGFRLRGSPASVFRAGPLGRDDHRERTRCAITRLSSAALRSTSMRVQRSSVFSARSVSAAFSKPPRRFCAR